MSDRCALCSLPPQTDARLCWKHIDALTDMLNPVNHGRPADDVAASIPRLYARLNPAPGGNGATEERRAPGFRSTPSASLHVVTMLDDRSRNDPQTWFDPHPTGMGDDWTRPHTEETNPPRAIRLALEGIVDSFVEEFDPIGPRLPDGRWCGRDVESSCGYLLANLDLFIAHPGVDELYRDLLELSDQTRRAIGDAPLGPSGWCIEMVRSRTYDGYMECGGPLTLLPPKPDPPGQTKEQAQRAEVARCPRCHRRYSWLDLIRIRYVNEPPA